MTTSMTALTFDCIDAAAAARFWADVLGGSIDDSANADFASVLQPVGTVLYFARVPEPKTAKNRLHIDLTVDDLDAEVERVVGLGATVHATFDEPSRWVTMLDPQGNEFCLVAA